jgi:hypothetical protein
MSSIIIAAYLDENEASELRDRLAENQIHPIVKRHGLPRLFGTMATWKVLVDRADFSRAKEIAGSFETDCRKRRAEASALLATRCPRCASNEIEKKNKSSFLQRLRFFGVTVWNCNQCGSEWYT